MNRKRLTPVSHRHLVFVLHPRISHASLGVPLRQPQQLSINFTSLLIPDLDLPRPRLEDVVVIKGEESISVPAGDYAVHAVIPGLQPLSGAHGLRAEDTGKLVANLLPLELLVMPEIDDEISLFDSVFFVAVLVTDSGLSVGVEFLWGQVRGDVGWEGC